MIGQYIWSNDYKKEKEQRWEVEKGCVWGAGGGGGGGGVIIAISDPADLLLFIHYSYCSLKPLWLGMGKVVPARTSPTLHPPSPSYCAVIILFKCPSASIVVTSTLRVKIWRD